MSSSPSRRTFLKLLSGSILASVAPMRAVADTLLSSDEFFVFIHASGGWDVMLFADPRNEAKGIIMPPSTANTTTTGIRRWVNSPLGDGSSSFSMVQPSGSKIVFGPAIGNLADHYDRITLVNGLAMNTVSHPDGTAFSSTGRHLAGGRSPASSIDTVIANELGVEQLLPSISVAFPSYVAGNINARAMPLKVDAIGSVGKVLTRTPNQEPSATRDAVTVLLTDEARELAKQAYYADAYEGLALQYEALRGMLDGNLKDAFTDASLRTKYPMFNYKGTFQGPRCVNLAFALEAMTRNIARCIGLSFAGFDTHASNYDDHAATQQEMFDALAQLIVQLESTKHPTKNSSTLADHTHILVFSDFCRTPQINLRSGRDHYPNNSAIVLSPKFRSNVCFGSTDPEQLLPSATFKAALGMRAPAPPDLLATFIAAFGVDPTPYMRDGEVIKELLT